MVRFLEHSRSLVLIAVIFSLLAAVAAFLLGSVKTVYTISALVASHGKDPLAAIALIELMDTFLIATALFIFSVGLYELFISDLSLPNWLEIHDLHDLKSKLGSVIILVMCVTFLKHLVEWQDPKGMLFFGIAVAVVSASLIAFSHFGGRD
ncbi:MAG: YqhA family protein [Nitrospirota bacterium]